MKKITVLLMAALVVAFFLASSDCEAAKATKEKMIANAKDALQAGGVNLVGVNIIYDDGNTFWQERMAFLETDNTQNHGILPHGILTKKKYQVVYFDFAESSPIADTWVFMDPETGDVIGIYEEK